MPVGSWTGLGIWLEIRAADGRNRMARLLTNLIREEGGLEMVEWAIVGALITGAALFGFTIIGAQMRVELLKIWGNLIS
jgi:Flp pilus assembly pilin Flp